jgi:fused signal recognition particle receptor
MFDKLKSGLKGLVTKVTTVEFKPENLAPILEEFKLTFAENDVAFPVADKVCDELEKRLTGTQVKRLEDRKKIIEDNLRQVLLEVMLTDKKIDILAKAEEKRLNKDPLILLFVGINGTGKTTSIAKVAQFFKDKKFRWFWQAATLTVRAALSSWKSMPSG